jgi:hypothetical protein
VDEDVRQLFRRDLQSLPEPPLGTLVRDSLQRGKRLRAVRRIYGAAMLAVGVGLATAVLVPVGVPHSAGLDAASSASGWTEATPEGVLQVLLDDLPKGRTSNYAKAVDGSLHVQAYLYDDSGPGMVRLKVRAGPDVLPRQRMTDRRSWTLAGGNTATVVGLPDDCTRSMHVEVRRPDGVVVVVDAGSCLSWSGFLLGQGRMALTQDQAVAIAEDPRLGFEMSKQLVKDGTERARGLATFDEIS